MSSDSGTDDDGPPQSATPARRRSSTLGLASRHALDASRVDDAGRKALHRFARAGAELQIKRADPPTQAGSCDVSAEHLQRVVEVHPEAASHVDHRVVVLQRFGLIWLAVA